MLAWPPEGTHYFRAAYRSGGNDRTALVACTILLVDDSEIVTESVKRWLKRDGYQVVVARNCAEAKAAAAGCNFAGHIVDLELSDGHGVELALWLKSEGHCAATVFFTGHAIGSHSLERAQQVGHVLTKGTNPTVLLSVLKELVDSNPTQRSTT